MTRPFARYSQPKSKIASQNYIKRSGRYPRLYLETYIEECLWREGATQALLTVARTENFGGVYDKETQSFQGAVVLGRSDFGC
jgi:hypothetical protein